MQISFCDSRVDLTRGVMHLKKTVTKILNIYEIVKDFFRKVNRSDKKEPLNFGVFV